MKNHCDQHSSATRGCRECWSIVHQNVDEYFCQAERARREVRETREEAVKRLAEWKAWIAAQGIHPPARLYRPFGECGGDGCPGCIGCREKASVAAGATDLTEYDP